jgi:hypothetical protein
MTKLSIAAALAIVFASSAWAQDYRRGEQRDRDIGGVPGSVIRGLEGRTHDRDDDCRTVIERHQRPDGDIVEERHRECD